MTPRPIMLERTHRTMTVVASALSCLLTLPSMVAAQPPAGRGTCLVIAPAASTQPGQPGQPGPLPMAQFSAAATVDLELVILLSPRAARAQEPLVELTFFTPRGHLYRSRSVPVALPDTGPRGRRLRGYPRPVPERPAREVVRRGEKWLRIEVSLPIAGTSIVRSGLYGEWRVEAELEGLEPSCSGHLRFGIGE